MGGAPTVGTAVALPAAAPPPRVPQSIHDVDTLSILGFGPELTEDHPVSRVSISSSESQCPPMP